MALNPVEKTILIVDDEADLCEILQFDLEDAGYQTLIASQAHEALDVLKNKEADLVVSDIRMPGGDGIFLLDALREKHFEIPPVIFVSGFADISVEEAYHKGANGVFSKPLATDSLLDYLAFTLNDPQDRWKKKSEWKSAIEINIETKSVEAALESKQITFGRGGFFINLDDTLPRTNEQIHFKLNFKESNTIIEGLGVCRWQRNTGEGKTLPKGIGIEFLELDLSLIHI